MATAGQSNNLAADVIQVVEQLERHCLAPDGSYVSKSVFSDLQLAREEMSRERTRYMEYSTLYIELVAMVEEYQQALAVENFGGTRDSQGHYSRLSGMMCPSQIYETLDHRLAAAEAAQRLRLPLVSKDGEVHEEEIEKLTMESGVSSDATGIGGVRSRFLGITSDFLWKVQQRKAPSHVDETHYQRSICSEMESRLEAKCERIAEIFATAEIDSLSLSQIPNARLPERVKLITEEIEKEDTLLLQDLYSMDRKFAEHYGVLEQILSVLIKFVKDLKLHHQHKFDEMRKEWLCKRCQTLNAKLRCLEYLLLCSTYTVDSVPALHRVREHLLEATTEASMAYNKAVTRLRAYQGVDPHFDKIAMEYHVILQKLKHLQSTIHEVEMDLPRSLNTSKSYFL
ncbi:HAUS augmin-like complex subunit [Wolffia australiana]